MSGDADLRSSTESYLKASLSTMSSNVANPDTPRMRYRSRPVSVAVDPISLVISECIAITSAIQKHARSPHSSVSAILGGSPNIVQIGPSRRPAKPRSRSPLAAVGDEEGSNNLLTASNRWGSRGQKGRSLRNDPIITGFARLRYEIAAIKGEWNSDCDASISPNHGADIRQFNALSLTAPFLQVIQTKGVAAPVTILCLGALRKFLAYGFVCTDSPRFTLAMQSLSAAVTHCQFDVSDSAQGEVVLLMILNLMEDMMSGPGGDILSDKSVCDMMGRGLAICSQPHFSPVLRRTAEISMMRMCQIIFEDVKHLEAEAGRNAEDLDQQVKGDAGGIKMREPTSSNARDVSTPRRSEDPAHDRPSSEAASTKGPDDQASNSHLESSATTAKENNEETESVDLKPYSLPSVRELFRVLVNFLDPSDRQHTDTMRVMAMRILHVALEVSGPFISWHPALAIIAEDRLCCYLFQLVRSDNMAVLQESLIVAGTLLATCREVLKLQQELFLSYLVACLHPSVHVPREPGIDPSLYAGIPATPKLVKPPPSQQGSGRSTPVSVKDRQKLGLEGGARKPDARQAMVESIGVLSRMPTFMVELFVNYDCDEDRSDLCEDIFGVLSRNALPDSATWSTTSVPPLCLDALLRYIQYLAERLPEAPVRDEFPDPHRLREQRRRKKIIIKGTSKFNENPKDGLGYLEAQGIISDAKDPVAVARFLKGTSRISKAVLGDFLSKKGNEVILKAFMGQFDFSSMRIDHALRILLETFRLPGEAPLIASIVESFSEQYCSSGTPDEVTNKDAVFILTYAIIILNTDQHNPNVKSSKRMTLEDFCRNLRGQNDGQDFSTEFLRKIYESIRSNEIILPDEHDNKHAFDYAWRELLLKSESAGGLIICNTNIYDSDMFAATWRPVISTLSYVFMSATEDAVFARIVTGFDECARIAARYRNTEALDQIVYCLSHMSSLAVEARANTSLNTEVQVGTGSVMVSELAVRLGRDFRAQLATLVLFRVITGNESLLSQGWEQIMQIWRNLFVNSLIPSFSSASNFRVSMPAITLQTSSKVVDRASTATEAGFFSAFTSYISSYAADDPPEPSEEELESTLCTIDCVKSCNMHESFKNICNLAPPTMMRLVQGLLEQIPERDQDEAVDVGGEPAAARPVDGQLFGKTGPEYDPSTAYVLEICTVLAIRDSTTVELLGKHVFDTLQRMLRESGQWHPIVVSRAMFYALMILKNSYEYDLVNVPVFLHTISSLQNNMLHKIAETTLRGLATCTDEPGPLRNEMMTSPDFWVILQKLSGSKDSASLAYDVLEKGSVGFPSAVMADNYEALVSLLDHFASAVKPEVGFQRNTPEQAQRRENGLSRKTELDESVVRACRAVGTLQSLTTRIPQLLQQSHLESSEAWSTYWLPLFQALTKQCTSASREVRQLSFSAMQRSLLSPEFVHSEVKEWTAIFDKVLFPLLSRLLKPEVYSSDKEGMSEMRVQAASLVCKVFLQYLVYLSEWDDGMLDLWINIIDLIDRLMNSGQGDSLVSRASSSDDVSMLRSEREPLVMVLTRVRTQEEAVRENLKNVALFMASTGHLVPPSQDPSKQQLWDETWKRLDRFLPDLRKDFMVEGSPEDKATAMTTATVVTPATEAERGAEVVDGKSGDDGTTDATAG